ncbi:MAG: flagellar motor switch protein FliG [Firmicutes bacterium]|nr:flagellar motor switch protein FliG [Bacillota bacterium]
MAESVRQRSQKLTGRQKAAVLLIALGPESAAQVFKHLREDEIERITWEIANMRHVDPEVTLKVLEEFDHLALAREHLAQGGLEYARDVLEKAVGPQRAAQLIERLAASLQVRPFDFARKTDPAQLLSFIQNEHPQTISLIMAHLHPDQAGTILSALPPERQVEVAKRLATLDRTSPEVLEEVEATLEKRLASFVRQEFTAAGGIEVAVEVLNRVDRQTERTIMEALEEDDPELAEEIKRRMFVFEDIVTLDNRSVQKVISEVETSVWALALKTASEDVANVIFHNLSKRAAEILREEIEYLGPVRLRDVEEAQQRIVATIRRLEEAGEIIIARGGGDEIVV